MRKIAIEEHLFSEDYLNYLRTRTQYPRLETYLDQNNCKAERMWRSAFNYTVQSTEQISKLTDTGAGRLAAMDKYGIDVQVLSVASPGPDELEVDSGTEIAKKINDSLAEVVKLHTDRFAALAVIAPGNPQEAAKELERSVKVLGLKGAKINSHGHGEYLDDPKYRPLFQKAEELNVPIYLHPKEPPNEMLKMFIPYTELASAMWGFGADASLHAMRLICSGLFDAFPNLKIILGHLGEGIPFWLWRIDNIWLRTPNANKLNKKPSEYFKDNFLVTTSGMFWEPAFLFVYQILGADNILFAIDYPYESMEKASRFMASVPICDSDKEKIYYTNAKKLFGL